jgi:glutamine amidotransferase
MEITVVAFGMGNLGAIPNMLRRIGAPAVVTSDPAVVARCEKLIIPGVGAFDAAMANLGSLGLIDALNDRALVARIPILGLCLGMELLARSSEEGSADGLGWIPGRVVRFRQPRDSGPVKIPHMGWNTVDKVGETPLLDGFDEPPRFYFAHSYHYECDDEADVVGVTSHGVRFPSMIRRENVQGVQFHPEKSHRFGLQLLANFVRV